MLIIGNSGTGNLYLNHFTNALILTYFFGFFDFWYRFLVVVDHEHEFLLHQPDQVLALVFVNHGVGANEAGHSSRVAVQLQTAPRFEIYELSVLGH